MSDAPTIVFRPSGREKMRCTAQGVTLYYTYADQDPQKIPEGMRRVTFLEPDPNYTPELTSSEARTAGESDA